MVATHGRPSPLNDSIRIQPQALKDQAETELAPSKSISAETVEFIKSNIGGEQYKENFEEWCNELKEYDTTTACGRVWGSEYIAYRCRTCAYNSCMSLCATCFEEGDHEGHDFNMFRSGAGGACDCGDTNVMSQKGICQRHQASQRTKKDVPDDLLTPSTGLIVKILHRVLHDLRTMFQGNQRSIDVDADFSGNDSLDEDDQTNSREINKRKKIERQLVPYKKQPEFSDGFTKLIEFLTVLVQTGTAMQDLVATILNVKICDFESFELHEESRKEFFDLRQDVYQRHKNLNQELQDSELKMFQNYFINEKSSVLEEFVFWLSRLHYPDSLNHFFLHLLPNDEYKKCLTRAFVNNYTFTAFSLTLSNEPDSLANRIVHISVQLLSNEGLVKDMVEDNGLLDIFLNSLTLLFKSTLTPANKNDRMNMSRVVNCHQPLVQKTVYWSIVSDYNNIIHHQSVAKSLIDKVEVLKKYLSIITWFTGMDVQVRALREHVEYDRMFYVSFYLEKEGAAVPLSGIVSIIKNKLLSEAQVLNLWNAAIEEYDDYISKTSRTDALNGTYLNQISFCLALPRLISSLFYHIRSNYTNINLTESIKNFGGYSGHSLYEGFILDAFHTIIGMHEIRGKLWVRNGDNARSLVHVYRQAQFCGTTFDLDHHLVQMAWANQTPRAILTHLLKRTRISPLISLRNVNADFDEHMDAEKTAAMLEATLTVLLTTVGVTKLIGKKKPRDQLKKEVVCLLAVSERGHAELTENIPGLGDAAEYDVGNFSLKTTDLDDVLLEVADFLPGQRKEQGRYKLNKKGWSLYDPIFSLHRTTLLRDNENGKMNYVTYMQEKERINGEFLKEPTQNQIYGIPYTALPDDVSEEYSGLFRLLSSPHTHSIIFTILWKFHDPAGIHTGVTDRALSYVLALLDWTIKAHGKHFDVSGYSEGSLIGQSPDDWSFFQSENIFENARKLIAKYTYRIEDKPTKESIEPEFEEKVKSEQGNSGYINKVHEQIFKKEGEPTSDGKLTGLINDGNGESIISMLLKLHIHLNGGRFSYTFGEAVSSVPRIQNLIAELLNSFGLQSLDCRKYIENLIDELKPKEASAEDQRAERKRKAKEKQNKLMEKMKAAQTKFLNKNETALNEIDEDTDDRPLCCVCRQAGDDLAHIGYTVVSRTLSGRQEFKHNQYLLEKETKDTKTVGKYNREMIDSLHGVLHFSNKDSLFSTPTGWKPELTIKACGHMIHPKCCQRPNQEVNPEAPDKYVDFEIICPVCRHYSNILLPSWKNVPVEDKLNETTLLQLADCIKDKKYENQVMTNHFIKSESNLPEAERIANLEKISEDIFKGLYDQYQNITDSENVEIDVDIVESVASIEKRDNKIFIVNRLREMVESEIVAADYEIDKDLQVSYHRPPFVQVFESFQVLWRRAMTEGTLRVQLAQILKFFSNDSLENDSQGVVNGVSLIFRDPFVLLLELLLTLYPLGAEQIRLLIKTVFNLAFISAVVRICVDMGSSNVKLWNENNRKPSGSYLRDLVTIVMKQRFNFDLIDDTYPVHTEWSNLDWCKLYNQVETKTTQMMMPFLKVASVIFNHFFPNCPLPPEGVGPKSDYILLSSYLKIGNEGELMLNEQPLWDTKTTSLITSIFSNFRNINSSPGEKEVIIRLLKQPTLFQKPRLLQPPRLFRDLLNHYNADNQFCSRCQEKPKKSVICLVCGELLCYNEDDFRSRNEIKNPCLKKFGNPPGSKGTVVQHTEKCGAGNGVFFILFDVTILLIYKKYANKRWGSIYLDKYNEEDYKIRRGKPLVLSKERLDYLEQIWATGSFNLNREWRTHHNRM